MIDKTFLKHTALHTSARLKMAEGHAAKKIKIR